MKKTLKSIIMILSLILSSFIAVSANDDITIYVNEQMLQCDTAPFIENGRTMVPMRKIFESLNAEVNWEDETKTITAVKENKIVILQIDNYSIFKNGEEESLDVAPVIVNDSTFVPIRAVSQSMEASVEWLDKTRSVYINSPEKYNSDMNTEEQVTIYAPDGRSIEVKQSEVEAYVNVGWYTVPVTIMYAGDGRDICVPVSEVDAYVNVGWYKEPVITMYSTDGRTIVINKNEETAYRNVGWYSSYGEAENARVREENERKAAEEAQRKAQEEAQRKAREEAEAARKAQEEAARRAQEEARKNAESAAGNSGNVNNNSNSYNPPNTGGSSVYRTPSGKRYHYDPNCGGKNSYKTTLDAAKSAGLTPCQKCA